MGQKCVSAPGIWTIRPEADTLELVTAHDQYPLACASNATRKGIFVMQKSAQDIGSAITADPQMFDSIEALRAEESRQYDLARAAVEAFCDVLIEQCPWIEGQGGDHPFDSIMLLAQRRMDERRGWRPYVRTSRSKKKMSNGLRKRVLERDAYRCRYCNTHIGLSLHHVIPESRGGETSERNLVAACMPCNLSIGTRFQPPAGWDPQGMEVPA